MVLKLTIAAFLMAVNLMANLVIDVPGGSGQWYSAVAPSENPATAFYSNLSDDGSQCNVGYWLADASWSTGVGTRCNNASFIAGDGGPGNLSFFGGTAGANTPVGWLLEAQGRQDIVLRLEVAGNSSGNSFGYGTYDSSGNRMDVALFGGSATPTDGATITIAAGSQYYFWLQGSGARLYSDATYDGVDPTAGKFALFSEIPAMPGASGVEKYWVGVEDRDHTSAEGWGDYNDFLITATEVVPEPGFYGVLALGLSGAYLVLRRRAEGSR